MNENLMYALGLGEMVELKKSGICPICKQKVDVTKLEGDIEAREFKISGLCHDCQVEVFNSPEE
jgi:hypothetical protein